MGKIMKRVAIVVLFALGIILITYSMLRVIGSLYQGYSWQEMDWNNDGKTTVFEFFKASDIGQRNVMVDGGVCVEYFSYKDALTIRIDCPDVKRSSKH